MVKLVLGKENRHEGLCKRGNDVDLKRSTVVARVMVSLPAGIRAPDLLQPNFWGEVLLSVV